MSTPSAKLTALQQEVFEITEKIRQQLAIWKKAKKLMEEQERDWAFRLFLPHLVSNTTASIII